MSSRAARRSNSRRSRLPDRPATRPSRRKLWFESLEDRRLLAPVPAVLLDVPGTAFIGENVNFTVTFDNTDTVATGYGPYVDLIIPVLGADGAGAAVDDGLTLNSATFLGTTLTPVRVPFNAAGQAVHPFAVNGSGIPIVVNHPNGAAGAGDELVVLMLPFGSFTAGQTPAVVNVSASMSNLADLNVPLTVTAYGGFRYGANEFDDPTTDPPLRSGPATDSVNPIIFEVTKEYVGPGDDDGARGETATGPNYPRQYIWNVEIAPGQPITNLTLTDVLPPNHIYTGIASVTVNGAATSSYTILDAPPAVTPPPYTAPAPADNNVQVRIDTTVTNSATVTVNYYIAEFRSPATPVIVPATGDKVAENNTVTGTGSWDPIDTRDPITPVSDTDTVTPMLREESIALQKSGPTIVIDNGAAGLTPDDVVQWTIAFQVSDFFAFDNLFVTDILSDGNNFDPTDPQLGHPNLTISEAGSSTPALTFSLSGTAAPFGGGANYYYSVDRDGTQGNGAGGSDPLHTGETTLQFDISKRLRDSGLDDQLVGGLFLNRNFNRGATTGQIVFRTRVLDQYRETFPSGDPSLNEDDPISNRATIVGDVLTAGLIPTGSSEADSDGAGGNITKGSWSKTIYAVNGNTVVPPTLVLTPGDTVTYRLKYNFVLADFEKFTFEDFLPLPIFRVLDPDANDYVAPVHADGPAWSHEVADVFTSPPTTTAPTAGQWKRGPLDTLTPKADANGDTVRGDVGLTTDGIDNSLTFSFGTYHDPANPGGTIDILFTVTATADPFADDLFLTNQATKSQQDTNNEPVSQTAIVQVKIGEPLLEMTKGVVATNRAGATFSPASVGPVGFTAPGTAGFRGLGKISSQGLDASPINSNLDGIDAGDLVTFAIVIENVGKGARGAFDVTLKDTLPEGFSMPPGGYNLSITDGTIGPGNAYTVTDLANAVLATDATIGAALFGAGLRLQDPGPTLANPDYSNGGGIDAYHLTSGRNVAIITYDLVADVSVQPNQTITNMATVFNYASLEGGPDFTVEYLPYFHEEDLEDDAQVTTTDVTIVKQLNTTSVVSSHNLVNQAAIGETITYDVVLTLPEGTTNACHVTDTLAPGLEFVSVAAVLPSSTDLTTSVSPGDFSIPADFTPDIAGDGSTVPYTLTFNLGNITNANRINTTLETVRLRYLVRVMNVTGNQAGGTRVNSARASWTLPGATPVTYQTELASAPPVTIIEPVLEAPKTVVVGSTRDAGDSVVYTITIRHTALSTTDAFDVTFSDPLPAGIASPVITSVWHSVEGEIKDRFEILGGGVVRTKLSESFDLPQTATVTVTISGTLDTLVTPNQLIRNTATVEWTSLAGDDDNERDGSGGAGTLNDYRATGTGEFNVRQVNLTKDIVETSEPHTTSNTNVAVGEIIRYRLVTQIPEGGLPTFQITDLLPDGLQFLDDGTAKLALVSTSGSGITSSDGRILTTTAGAGVAGNSGSVVPTWPIPPDLITPNPIPPATFGSGEDPVFALGDLTNGDADGDDEYVVIEFNARVLNLATVNGTLPTPTSLANQFRVQFGTQTVDSGFMPATVQEPAIVNLGKQILPPLPLDAGDTATYQVTYTNTGTTTAFDVQVIDLLPAADLDLDTTLGSITVSCPLCTGVIHHNSLGNQLNILIDAVPSGALVQIDYSATLLAGGITPGEKVTNVANLTYTSLPGSGTALGADNLTGSIAGPAGSDTGERTGSGTPSQNDYNGTDNAEFTTVEATGSKSIVKTSEPATVANDLAVGEIARYRLVVGVPEGTASNAVLRDLLPLGLQFLDGTARVAFVSSTVGNITSTLITDPDLLTAPQLNRVGNETTLDSITPDFPLPPGTVDGSTPLRFLFGTVTNAEQDVTAEYVVLEFNALVLNTTDTNRGDVKSNRFEVLVDNVVRVTSNYVDATIVEPSITVDQKEVVSPLPPNAPDAGDLVTYRVTYSNAVGAATAFDVQLLDSLPAELELVLGSVSVTLDGSPIAFTDASDLRELDLVVATVPAGSEVIVEYQTRLLVANVNPGETVLNTARVTYTSLPGLNGTSPNDTGSSNTGLPGASDGERTGTGTPVVNDYAADDDASLILAKPTADKRYVSSSESATSDDSRQVAVGEIVRYRLEVGVPEGTSPALQVIDALPLGLKFLEDNVFVAFVSSSGTGLSSTLVSDGDLVDPHLNRIGDEDSLDLIVPTFPLPVGAISGGSFSSGTDPIFGFGQVVNSEDDATREFIVLEFNALVMNVADVNNGDVKSNTFEVRVGGSPLATSNAVTVTVVEPLIDNVSKFLTGATPQDAGDVANYRVTFRNTGTADAFDVQLLDILPAALRLSAPGSVTVTPSGGVTNNSTPTSVDVRIASVPVGGSVTVDYAATLQGTVLPDQLITNTATVTYTSLSGASGTDPNPTGSTSPGAPGSDTGERTGSGVGVNDYRDTDDESFRASSPQLTKAIVDSSLAATGDSQYTAGITDLAIGETVTYRVTATLIEGTSAVVVSDYLPSVLSVVSSRVVSIGGNTTSGATSGGNISGSSLAVGAAGTASDFTPFDGRNDRVRFDFGTLVNMADGEVSDEDRLVVEVVALVENSGDNVDGDYLVNAAVMGDVVGTVAIEIVEPLLGIEKSAAPVDGNKVRYTVRVADPSPTAAAYNVVITDLLADPGITLVAGSVMIAPAPATTVPTGNITIATGNGGSDTTVRINVSTFPLGGVLVFTYDAILADPANQTASIENTADLTWWSLPGGAGRQGTDSDDEKLGAIGDRVWYDDDRDGVQDAIEDGIAGVPVELIWAGPNGVFGDGDDVTLTTVTDVNGSYQFSGLPAGVYRVTATEPVDTSPTYDKDGGYDSQSVLTLAAGQINRLQDFGYVRLTSTIGDRVWLDEDADGVQDAGEDGIANVKVVLLDGAGNDIDSDPLTAGVQPTTTVTGVDGGYLFHDLPPGDYRVRVDATTLPAGLRNGTYDEDDGTTAPDGQTDVTLGPGEEYVTADFGYNWAPSTDVNGGTNTGAIGDRVWIDTNGDGVQDPDEIGLPGVTVTLQYDSDGDGDIDAPYPSGTATTDATGHYMFDGLPAGIYEVVVTPLGGYTQTGDPDGTLDHKTTAPVVLAPGDVYVNADFGYRPTGDTGSIGDTVWFDADADQQGPAGTPIGTDATEYGIAGVTVSLIRDSDGDGAWDAGEPVIATVVTDEFGRYLFAGLPVTDGAGTDDYLVWVSDTANVLDGLQPTFDDDGVVVTANLSAVTNLTTTAVDDQDFGYAAPDANRSDGANGVIGDMIFIDFDADNTFDAGEGREGVTVDLYNSTGTTLLATTVTDENGRYYFADLNTALGYLVVVPASNFVAGGALAGTNNTVDPNADNNNLSLVTTFPDGANLTQDFGYRPTVPNTIGGTIWRDTDADGTLEGGEPGRFGVTVVLLDQAGNVVAATTTAGDGTYSFTGLPNGTYTVDVTDEANVLGGAWHSLGSQLVTADGTSKADPYSVTVSNGSNVTTVDFGYYRDPAALGDYVWVDLDGDGLQDGGEPGLNGVPVTLRVTYPNGTTTTVVTVTGDNSATPGVETGWYSFGNLLLDENFDGVGGGEPTYALSVGTPAGYVPSPANQGGSDLLDSDLSGGQPATLTEGQTDPSYDFGFVPQRGSIGDRVWLDEDGDRVQDAGEDGIAGLTVTLSGADVYGNTVSLTTVTGADGGYAFNDLLPGTYTVTVNGGTTPSGMVQTFDPDASVNNAHSVTLAAGQEYVTADFGYNWTTDPATNTGTGAIGDRVWIDADGDGRQDPGEAGLGNVTVTLTNAGADGIFGTADDTTATTATDADGSYVFDNLTAGAYRVVVTPPANYTQTGDPDYFGTTLPAGQGDQRTTSPIILAPGDMFVNADFGYQPAVGYGYSIGDLIWVDPDGDRTQDAGEPGIAGVTVTLLNNGGQVVATTVTSADDPATPAVNEAGTYTFRGLPNGSYAVVVTDTANVLGDLVPISNPVGDLTLDDRTPVTVSGANVTTADIGYAPPGQNAGEGLIGDTIFLDRDAGNDFDAGEGLEGVRVQLYLDSVTSPGVWDASDTLLQTTLTNENGQYFFGGLAAGNYVVRVDTGTLPAGVTNTVDPGSVGPLNESAVTLAAGSLVNLAQDFGYRDTSAPNTISGTVWRDTDADGTLDGTEAGRYQGVTVVLRDANGNIVATTTTNASGDYTFSNLPDGAYTVDVTDEANVLGGAWHSLGDQSVLVDGTSKADPYSVTVSNGSNVTTVDFGYYRDPAALGNYVWDDLNANGIQEVGEPGLNGVPVTLRVTYPNGTTTTVVTVTGDNPATPGVETGWYSFGNLLLDENFDGVGGGEPSFEVSVDALLGYLPSPVDAGTPNDDAADSDDHDGQPVTLVRGQTDDTIDFGWYQPVTIGDRVWNDANANGQQDDGETGLDDVVVSLYRPGFGPDGIPGNADDALVVATQTTPDTGAYSFTDLPPGSYQVGFGALSGYSRTLANQGADASDSDADAGTGFTGTVAVPAGTSNNTLDAGYYQPVTIGDRVWNDANANGQQDGGETGLDGVVVSLYRPGFGPDGIPGNADDATVVATQPTAGGGAYSFTNLPPGSYQVGFGALSGYSRTLANQGDDTSDSDANASTGLTTTVAVPAGTSNNTLDAGYYQPVTIGNFVWNDANANGQQDASESGLASVVVSLYRPGFGADGIAGNADDALVVATQTTPASGAYSFTNLPPGSYQVLFGGLDGYNRTRADQGNDASDSDADAGTGLTDLVAMPAGASNNTLDAGYYQPASIGDGASDCVVWLDEDGDGERDAGEDGIANARVTLVGDIDGDGDSDTLTTWTGVDGSYIFRDLVAGTYTVTVTVDSDLNPTFDPNGIIATPHTTVVTLAAGQESAGTNFGYNWVPRVPQDHSADPPAGATGAIGDRIWSDADGDGRQDPSEPGLGGVTVTLYGPGGDGIVGTADDAVLDTATTDGDGSYIFDGLAAGVYAVAITAGLPAGYAQTGDPDYFGTVLPVGARDGRTTVPIVLAPGDVFVNADFGYQPDVGLGLVGTIGDYVWFDANADEIQDPGEPGLANVRVSLIQDADDDGVWDTGEPIIATVLTGSAGDYQFTGVPVTNGVGTDDYLVWVSDTLNVLGTWEPTYDDDGIVTENISWVRNLTSAGVSDQDFGYAPAVQDPGEGLIGDTIFLDRDADGLSDAGEGLEGVRVRLYTDPNGDGDPADGVLLASTTSNENGTYAFGGLAAGRYVVQVDTTTLPGTAGQLTNTVDPDTASPGNSRSAVTLLVGGVNLSQDFGYRDLTSPNQITGTLWEDGDADGALESDEPSRWAGVTVALYAPGPDGAANTADDVLMGTTVTDSFGNYTFSNLPNGTFTVDVTDDDNVLAGTWHSLGTANTNNRSQADPLTVTLTGGTTGNADFGYYVDPAALGNFVFYDLDRDGIQDVGESGLAGIAVTLTITYPNGDVTTVLAMTDSTGYYSFGNLLLDENFDGAGSAGVGNAEPAYLITVSTPSGYAPSPIDRGASDALDSDNPAGQAATVAQGQTNVSFDFGFLDGSLSGLVFRDNDGDAVRDAGEPVMAGVIVYLDTNDNDALDAGEPTQTTNASGLYTFDHLLSGTYIVRQLVPDGFRQTLPVGGGANLENLTPGELATGLNFGNTVPAGTVLDDGDPDVVLDGPWLVSYCPLFYGADGRYLCNGTGTETVTWTFNSVTAGTAYRVSTTWLAGSAFTTAAQYQVASGANTASATMNQQLSPSAYPGYSASGYYWADLATALVVPSGSTSLTVRLTAPATGCVNADAVRIMPVSTPEITVLNGTASLTDGSSTVDMGGTGSPGVDITYTFTVRNDGGGTLNLGTLSVPTGFVPAGPASSALAPGATTTFSVTLPRTLAAGPYSGQVVVGNNDNNEAPFNFTIQGTVGSGTPTPQPSAPPLAPVVPLAAVPILALSEGGTVLPNVFGSVDFGSVTVGAAASRTFTVTNTGTADVDLCPPTLPTGFSLAAAYGDASLTPGQSTTFAVSLITGAVGTFSGDMVLCNTSGEGLFSVQLTGTVTEATVPTATKAIIDDGDAAFTAGGFTTYSAASGYLGDVRYATQNTAETKVAQWQFSLPGLGLADGLYRVSTLWYVESSRASQATFKLYNGAAAGTPQATAVVNQQLAPRADVVDEGRNWQDLGVVLVSGGVLTVTVSDLAVGGAVVADAVRIERVVAPEIQLVLDSTGADLVDGSGVVNFGSVFAGATSQLMLRVKNVGAGTIDLSLPTLTGPFTLVSGPARTTLSANDGAIGGADETTVTIALDTSASGSKSGMLALVNSDADENPFDLTLQGTVSSVKIIDDGDSGFVQSGPSIWLTWADGYQRDLRYSAKNTGRSATWTFTDLPDGTYRVSTTWVRNSNRATNSPYTISDGGGTVLVNQELAPNHSSFTWLLESGKYFADLAAGVAVSDGTLVVSLTDVGANEYVVADAVRIERLSPLLASFGAASPQGTGAAIGAVPAETVGQAIAYWAAGDVAAAAKLSAATILVADLPERHLGLASPTTNTVWLDADAGGWGWETHAGGVDLGRVLAHEFGHLLGLDDLDSGRQAGAVMAGEISLESLGMSLAAMDPGGDLLGPERCLPGRPSQQDYERALLALLDDGDDEVHELPSRARIVPDLFDRALENLGF